MGQRLKERRHKKQVKRLRNERNDSSLVVSTIAFYFGDPRSNLVHPDIFLLQRVGKFKI